MKDFLRKTESRILLFLIGNALLFLFLFYHDLNKRIDISERRIIGSVEFKKNVIQRKYDDHMVWESLSKDSPITNRDTIRSDSFSDAIIRLNDGTEISMDENSMFYLDISGADPTLDFSSGNINVKKSDSNSDLLKIKSQDRTITVGKGELNLNKADDGQLTMHVDKGSVSISNRGQSQTIESGSMAKLGEGGEVQVKKVPFLLINPNNNQIITAKDETGTVRFDWKPEENYSSLSLEVSRDSKFKNLIYQSNFPGQSENVELPLGSYYWRLKSNVGNSAIYRFHIYKESKVNNKLPMDEVILTFVEKLPSVNFQWNQDPLAKDYVLEIADSKKFNNLASRHTTKSTSLAVDNLTSGTYYWRVKTIPITPSLPEKVSPVKNFKIQQGTEFQLPELVRPVDEKVSVESYPKTGLHIWNSSNELVRFQFQLSDSPQFTKLIANKESTSNFIQPNVDLPIGTYYWRLQGISATGKASQFTKPARFEIVDPKDLDVAPEPTNEEKKPEPKKAPLLAYPVETVVDLSGQKSLNFRWNSEGKDIVYILSIYNEEDGRKKPVHQVKTKETTYNMTNLSLLDEGKFSWEVVTIAGNKQLRKEASHFVITLTKLRQLKPSDIEFISPSTIYKEGSK